MRPLRNNIIIKKLEAETQSAGGIILTETAQEVPTEGEVISCGIGVLDRGKRVPLDVKVGDIVLFSAFAGTNIKFDGEEYLIMLDSEVLAVTEEAKK